MSKATIVVIIPDSELREKIVNHLLGLDYRVFEAHGTTGGMLLIEEHQPDVVIVWNEGLNGRFLDENNEPIRDSWLEQLFGIIWVSSNKNFAWDSGLTDFLHPPFDMVELKLRLNNLIEYEVKRERKRRDENQSSS